MMTQADKHGFLVTGVFMVVFLACLVFAAFMSNTPVEGEDRESIPCPEGYQDCTGIPVPTPTPVPTPPAATPVPDTPTPSPTPPVTYHRHDEDGDGVDEPECYRHDGKPHLKPNPSREMSWTDCHTGEAD